MDGPSSFVAHIANLVSSTYLWCVYWLCDCSNAVVMSVACKLFQWVIYGSESYRSKWNGITLISLNLGWDNDAGAAPEQGVRSLASERCYRWRSQRSIVFRMRSMQWPSMSRLRVVAHDFSEARSRTCLYVRNSVAVADSGGKTCRGCQGEETWTDPMWSYAYSRVRW